MDWFSSAIWLLISSLPRPQSTFITCFSSPEENMKSKLKVLWSLGKLDMPLLFTIKVNQWKMADRLVSGPSNCGPRTTCLSWKRGQKFHTGASPRFFCRSMKGSVKWRFITVNNVSWSGKGCTINSETSDGREANKFECRSSYNNAAKRQQRYDLRSKCGSVFNFRHYCAVLHAVEASKILKNIFKCSNSLCHIFGGILGEEFNPARLSVRKNAQFLIFDFSLICEWSNCPCWESRCCLYAYNLGSL